MSISEIGCCGAYCKTCKAFTGKACKGCKIGYDNGERDISKSKCKIKVCCVKQNYNSCADCPKYGECLTVNGFYNKNGYKYKKYRSATQYIKQNGYDAFISVAGNWKNAHGKY